MAADYADRALPAIVTGITTEVVRDSARVREDERITLEGQLMQPFRGGLTREEIRYCNAAFSKDAKMEMSTR